MNISSVPASAPEEENEEGEGSHDNTELKSSIQNTKPEEKRSRPKKGFAGLPCLAWKDDGTMCRTIISSYTLEITHQACTPCLNRNAFSGRKTPDLAVYDPVTQTYKHKPRSKKL